MKRSELLFTSLLVPLDLLMIFLSFVLAYKFRLYFEYVPAIYIEPFSDYFRFILYLLPGWLIVFALTGLYSMTDRPSLFREFGKIFVAVSASIAIVMAWIFLSRTFFFSRLIIAFGWAIAIILVFLGRLVIRFFQRILYRFGIGVHRVIVLSSNGQEKFLLKEIKANPQLGYRLVKTIDHRGISKLEKIISRSPCDEILIIDTDLPALEFSKLLEFCRERNLAFKMLPNTFLLRSSHVDVQTIKGILILEFKRTPLDGWGRIIKRIVDFMGSLVLLIIFSPMMILVSLAIKLTSRGPILFYQERVGLNKNFIFFKFRTMREGAWKEHGRLMKKHGLMFKLKNDPRLSPIGGFLRRTSLDELPQFFNVLRGDMSLIGPRPPMPEEVARYNHWQKQRLGVKPGITGLWQVSGRSDLSFDEWVRLDAYYIENWSLWLDFQIILKTAWVVIKGRGAY